ncbi:tetratricopeptide repeat protein [Frateuria sp. STR12]|uniref:tetratricopeptide repeat protein n=1 Tax=Frateuria hangzhouensis TaxID=2995589 RepID=UPI002260F792|nr:tetratricopeptide repeat protein [Frateuria sp. STR12]MCX7513025.1 tetratricopeptide repeat protein [Frateuria sp. STR12]
MSVAVRVRLATPALAALLLAGCFSVPPQEQRLPAPDHDMVAAIRAAGAREQSVIDVAPLQDPSVAALREAAQADERAGRYADAAARLDQALKLSAGSPDLLQERAEVAVRLHDYATAERLARQSWSLGPQLGPLCARNWQTIVEMRLLAGDQPGAATARKGVQDCHKPGVPRY